MAVQEHENFHMEMIADAVSGIPEEEITRFVKSLDSINRYLVKRKHPPIRGRGPFRPEPVKLGKQTVPVPIFQGALSVGLSMSPLAAAVSREGGVGVIASLEIGYNEPDYEENPEEANIRALKREVKQALDQVKDCENRGPIGVNVMWSSGSCRKYVEAAVEAGAEVIICGAGIPTTLPSYCKDKKVALVPIISSRRAAALIIRNWAKKYNRTPDGFIFQGPLAGGYLGIKESQIEAAEEDFYKNISDIKTEIAELGECPLIVGGGLYYREDLERAFSYGADGFQIGTRFVTTKECSAGENFKNAYLRCEEKDVEVIANSDGFPGRVIASDYSKKIAENPELISAGLINAARDNLEEGLIFCGGKVQETRKIETVAEIFRELAGERQTAGEDGENRENREDRENGAAGEPQSRAQLQQNTVTHSAASTAK